MAKFTEAELDLLTKVRDGDVEYDTLSSDLQDRLYEYFLENGMPYGTAKARTGDPIEYVCDHLDDLVGKPFKGYATVVA